MTTVKTYLKRGAVTIIAIWIIGISLQAYRSLVADELLDRAVHEQSVGRTKLALALGANPSLENEYHVSMLAHAAYDENLDLVTVLLQSGADPDIRDYMGHSVIKGIKDPRIAALFQQAMQGRKRGFSDGTRF